MFTDDYGAKLLIEGIQLEFDVVSIALNRINGHDPKLQRHHQNIAGRYAGAIVSYCEGLSSRSPCTLKGIKACQKAFMLRQAQHEWFKHLKAESIMNKGGQ